MQTALRQITDQDVRETTSSRVSGIRLGDIAITGDGRWYRFAQAGATDLDPGKITVNVDVDTDVVNKLAAATKAIGSTEVVLDAAGATDLDKFRDGYLTVNDATGEGISYLVTGNTATSGAAELTAYLQEPLKVALTVDVSEVTLTQNPWDDIVISATDQADFVTGVPNVTIDDLDYGWVQTRGICSVLFDEAVAKGLALTIGTGVAGAVEALDAAGEPQIGYAVMAGVDTEYQPAYLAID